VYADDDGKAFAENAQPRSARERRSRSHREHDRLVQPTVYR